MAALLQKVVFVVFRTLARLSWPEVAAFVLLLMTRSWSATGDKMKRCYRALVLPRAGFQEDVAQSFCRADDFEIFVWPSDALKAMASAYLPTTLDHNNYVSSDPAVEASKARLRKFLASMWRSYTKKKSIDVVLTGNFAYYTEREFATILEEAGTPFIAIHKENVRPPKRVKDYWFTLYKERRGKFTGRKILVYNEIERDLEIASGIVDADRVVVTGMPRLDRLHRWRLSHVGKPEPGCRPHILFFAFSRHDKLTAIQRKPSAGMPGNIEHMEGWDGLSWGSFCLETHRAIVDLARQRPDLDVTIKSKGQSRKLNDILQTLEEVGPLPINVFIVTSGDPYELIARSQVVVGFNTTGLLEAIAAGKSVIVPRFGEACRNEMRDLIIDLGGAVHYAGSPDELKTMIASHAEDGRDIAAELPHETERVLRHWTGNDDGGAGSRVAEAVRSEIRRSAYPRRNSAPVSSAPA
jgi:hypothetical protein